MDGIEVILEGTDSIEESVPEIKSKSAKGKVFQCTICGFNIRFESDVAPDTKELKKLRCSKCINKSLGV